MNYPEKKIYCCENCDQCTFPSATDGCRPFSHPGACMPNIFSFGGTTLLLFRRHMQCRPKRRYSSCQRCPELCSLHTLVCNMAKTELKNVCACPRLTCQSIVTMYIYYNGGNFLKKTCNIHLLVKTLKTTQRVCQHRGGSTYTR